MLALGSSADISLDGSPPYGGTPKSTAAEGLPSSPQPLPSRDYRPLPVSAGASFSLHSSPPLPPPVRGEAPLEHCESRVSGRKNCLQRPPSHKAACTHAVLAFVPLTCILVNALVYSLPTPPKRAHAQQVGTSLFPLVPVIFGIERVSCSCCLLGSPLGPVKTTPLYFFLSSL